MGKFRIEHDKPNCIGCAACTAIHDKHWVMNDDTGKAEIVGGKNLDNGCQEMDIEQEDYDLDFEAAESCPVNVIHLIDKESGKKLI